MYGFFLTHIPYPDYTNYYKPMQDDKNLINNNFTENVPSMMFEKLNSYPM